MENETLKQSRINLVPKYSLCSYHENEYTHLMFSYTYKKVMAFEVLMLNAVRKRKSRK